MTPKFARSRKILAALPADPYESAKIAGLRYVTADGPGIRRERRGKGFAYRYPDGKIISDEQLLQRIRSLVIPPAWTNVWICPSPNGHLQAVGRDARGRKQYRYHSLYRAVRDQTKYLHLASFGEALPAIRKQVEHDLRLPGLPKQKVLATVVRLLDRTAIRVGNEEYVKENDSYGLTTMRENQVEVEGRTVHFRFRGKSGVQHDVELTDRKVAGILQRIQELPGEELFHYLDDNGGVCRIYSEDVNEYLKEITGQHITAKDFRTWTGTGEAAMLLNGFGPAATEADKKKHVVAAVKTVASKLGNRPATCRKYYIHPAVLDAYSDGSLFVTMQLECECTSPDALRREEYCVLTLITAHIPATPRAA